MLLNDKCFSDSLVVFALLKENIVHYWKQSPLDFEIETNKQVHLKGTWVWKVKMSLKLKYYNKNVNNSNVSLCSRSQISDNYHWNRNILMCIYS